MDKPYRLTKVLSMLALFVLLGFTSFLAMDVLAQNAPIDNTILSSTLTYPIVDTAQTTCYDDDGPAITCPTTGQAFYGQDAQFDSNQPNYTLSTDGLTVYDNVTGLTWTQSPDLNNDGEIDIDDKLTFAEAQTYADTVLNPQSYGGYNDWRLPTIKELYSLMDFSGTDPSGPSPTNLLPFIDTDYFDFGYGDEGAGERLIDAQFASSTLYVGEVMNGQQAMFGLNLADGRIKGYGTASTPIHPGGKTFYVYFVRGNTDYGQNDLVDNGDGTITDNATGLMWSQDDSGPQVNPENPDGGNGPRSGMNWEDALAWVQQKNAENYMGYDDWRLPNAKEMQSVLDYTRAPEATNSAAIDPIFNITQITNEAGEVDYPWFWTSTTHVKSDGNGAAGAYICFGRSTGYMNGSWLDVHGAGAQRSDKKGGDFTGYNYEPDGYYLPQSPQGDSTRIYNYVRLVRDADVSTATPTPTGAATDTPTPTSTPTPKSTDIPDNSTSIFLPLVLNGEANPGSGSDEEYFLFAPLNSTSTSLIDEAGETIHTWQSAYRPGNAVYLLEDGHILRTGNTRSSSFDTGGAGGIVQEIDSDGTILWEFEYDSSEYRLHHDIEVLPDGNILMIAWELKTSVEAIAAGRNPNLLRDNELWPDHIIEVDPATNEIVWEWHVWDHLVQDYDPEAENYGVVADHPELIDLNFIGDGPPPGIADWNHTNSVDYNAELDQILLSVHNFSEIWVIDHSTTTAEAASHSGGNSGKGGDLLYRWGNPQAYDAGSAANQQLFVQHDAQWIPDGYPGEDNILIFNNGTERPGGNYSSVDEIVPPVDASGNYTLVPGSAYAPTAPTWTYTADTPADFYATNISGAQRLPDGSTLICDGPAGHFFEVTSAGEIIWEYQAGSSVFRVTRYEGDFLTWIENR